MSRIRAIYDIQYSRDLEKKLFAMGLDFTKQNTTEVYEVTWNFSLLSNVLSIPAMKIDGLVLKYGCDRQQMTIINPAICKSFHLSTISEASTVSIH